jgi:hypothetical protein
MSTQWFGIDMYGASLVSYDDMLEIHLCCWYPLHKTKMNRDKLAKSCFYMLKGDCYRCPNKFCLSKIREASRTLILSEVHRVYARVSLAFQLLPQS